MKIRNGNVGFNEIINRTGFGVFLFVLIFYLLQTLNCRSENYQFVGLASEPSNGLTFMRARYYDADTGRFLVKDSYGINSGPNMYNYAASDPVNNVDYNGLATVGIGYSGSGAIWGLNSLSLVTTLSVNGANPLNWRLGTSFSYSYGISTTVGASSGVDLVYSPAQSPEQWNGISLGGGGSAAFGPSADLDVSGYSEQMLNKLYATSEPFTTEENQSLRYDLTLGLGIYVPDVGAPIEAHGLGGITTSTSISPLELLYTGAVGLDQLVMNPLSHVLGSTTSIGHDDTPIVNINAPVLSIPTTSSQPPVGGVLLNTAATLVGQNLSDITGAMYDPVSGQFVFLGTNSPTPVKNINLDYLTTALQAVYGSAVPPLRHPGALGANHVVGHPIRELIRI